MKTILGLLMMALLVADQPRRVLLFYTENGSDKWKAQVEAFEGQQNDMRERDIEIKSIPYSKANAREWRKWKIDSSNAFTFILVGRDGGEKLRSSDIVTSAKLFGTIDAMPMRKQEVKKNR
ncbi:DUF4174 domain-containing protein [Dyadobacter sp. CY326]|uniref:DUF4174 domain-containing protein n=1 Tax=Dyadobacter sp. CY326 TaxID=2907300 RepID=UPI001F21A0E2|nr:DUF4174 domain-containing protein [Dyadobacter sp. CY326]MCE7065136.1 DUF4174 domain-containing protein [Dyadobacter sp. CY326]